MLAGRHHEHGGADRRPELPDRLDVGGRRAGRGRHDGDPELWADILLDNAGHLAVALKRFAGAVEKLLAAVAAGDRRRLVALLAKAKEGRDALGN